MLGLSPSCPRRLIARECPILRPPLELRVLYDAKRRSFPDEYPDQRHNFANPVEGGQGVFGGTPWAAGERLSPRSQAAMTRAILGPAAPSHSGGSSPLGVAA